MSAGSSTETRCGALSPELDLNAARNHLFATCIDDQHHLEAAWRADPGDETVHDFRVGIRRVRVLLRIFRRGTRFEEAVELDSLLTDAADALGSVRDLDVVMALLAKVGKPGREIAGLTRQLAKKRALMLAEVERFLSSDRWMAETALTHRFMKKLQAGDGPGMDVTLAAFFEDEFRRRLVQVRKARKDARSKNVERLHRFRRRLRRIRYLGDVLGAVAPQSDQRLIRRIHRCERALGRVHDVDLARELVAERGGSKELRKGLTAMRRLRREKFLDRWDVCRKHVKRRLA